MGGESLFPLRVQPIGMFTPTSILLEPDVLRYFADHGVATLPWVMWLAAVSPRCLAVARCSARLGMCRSGDPLAPGFATGAHHARNAPDADGQSLPDCPPPGARLALTGCADLELHWPSDRRFEAVRIYQVDWLAPPPLIVTGTIFDVMI